MSNTNESLDQIMDIEGAFACALVNFESGMTLGTRASSNGFNIDLAASGNTELVRSKMKVMEALDISGGIEDILVTLDTQYHLVRPLRNHQNLFLYVAIDRKRGNLGMARHQLSNVERTLSVGG